MADNIKIIVAFVFIALGCVSAFYLFPDVDKGHRVLMVLGGFLLAGIVRWISELDKVKILIAAACVVLGLWGYYNYIQISTGWRALMIVGGIALGALVLWLSKPGKDLLVFAKEAWQEGGKVAWPTRQETIRMTLIVFVFVVVMSLFLFSVDQIIAWIIKLVMGDKGV